MQKRIVLLEGIFNFFLILNNYLSLDLSTGDSVSSSSVCVGEITMILCDFLSNASVDFFIIFIKNYENEVEP